MDEGDEGTRELPTLADRTREVVAREDAESDGGADRMDGEISDRDGLHRDRASSSSPAPSGSSSGTSKRSRSASRGEGSSAPSPSSACSRSTIAAKISRVGGASGG